MSFTAISNQNPSQITSFFAKQGLRYLNLNQEAPDLTTEIKNNHLELFDDLSSKYAKNLLRGDASHHLLTAIDFIELIRRDKFKAAEILLGEHPRPLLFLAPTGSVIHGMGCFAGVDIPANTWLGEYTGLISAWKAGYEKDVGDYHFNIGVFGKYEDESKSKIQLGPAFRVDATDQGNEFRFVNHAPLDTTFCNTYSYEIFDPLSNTWRVFMRSLRDISKGEEIRYDYGSDYFAHHQRREDPNRFRLQFNARKQPFKVVSAS